LPATAPKAATSSFALPTAATLGALGIVYGDIGTSPLYAFREAIKAASSGGSPSPEVVLGVVSLIIWSLILIISLKYAILILQADNRGEGGIVALLALLRARRRTRERGAALFLCSAWWAQRSSMAMAPSRRQSPS
jgi:KUP system potassium uptake protein